MFFACETGLKWYDRFIERAQPAYFGVIAMCITVSAITGGITLMFILLNRAPIWQMVIAICLVLVNNNTPVITQRLKYIVNVFIITESGNLILLVINFSIPSQHW